MLPLLGRQPVAALPCLLQSCCHHLLGLSSLSGSSSSSSSSSRQASTLTGVIETEDGKTKLQGYLPHSFVVNTVNVEGPILCLPDTWLLWDIKGFEDITPDSLALLELVEPPPEVLIVGCGSRIRQLPPQLQRHLQARGLAVEALDTRNAISYFNFLNDEGRQVVGALLPAAWGEQRESS